MPKYHGVSSGAGFAPCRRCGSKLPFRSSTPLVWASGVSSHLLPTTHFTRTSTGQYSLPDPGGQSWEGSGWLGGPHGVTPGPARPGLRLDFSRQGHLYRHPGQCHHQHPGWLRHLLCAGLHVSGAGCACGPGRQSRWAGCLALAGEGVCRAQLRLGEPAYVWAGKVIGGYAKCVPLQVNVSSLSLDVQMQRNGCAKEHVLPRVWRSRFLYETVSCFATS